MIKKGVAAQKRKSTSLSTDAQLVNKVRFVLTKGHGPLRTAAPTGWFLAVIYVIMVKNTVTCCVFRRKSNETAPKRGTKLSKRTQQAQRFFDSLNSSLSTDALWQREKDSNRAAAR